VSKDALIHILENADRSTGLWRYLKAEMPTEDIIALCESIDNPALRPQIEQLIYKHPANKNNIESEASFISYRRADLFRRIEEKNTPCTITFMFRRDYGCGGTRVEGATYVEGATSDWPKTVFHMIKSIEDQIDTWPEHVQRQYDSLVKSVFPDECAKRCVSTIVRQPEYISYHARHNHETSDCELIIKVKKEL
jgi:hypothetical protein